ncbi:TPA: hypothetical protein N2957_000327 [Vibrio parahaemolyticus]|nr:MULTISPECIES: hypothetical protein [Vibrio]EJG1785468.1 hypothetical protein [Vibrio parahaemolyticus]EJG1963862.1 hypothetical protein [Vibrio parahaemolyticus]MBD6983391.1 hypothetical protein [Vibrio parahaemolyticus]MBY4654647.1 hypothetical protein [Vibrio parahaemolyticus]MCX8829677.1 hypothetical protein [Vibrio parahaemolyticus]
MFSIAVHEASDCVVDLIENVFKYNDNVAIVVHCKSGFDFNLDREHVFINPKSYNTGIFDQSLVVVHLSNLYFLETLNMKFKVFSILGSNEMFVKSGLFKYVSTENEHTVCPVNKLDIQTINAFGDKKFVALTEYLGLEIKKSQPEGCFYNESKVSNFFKSEIREYFYDLEKYFIPENRIRCFYRKNSSKLSRLMLKLKVNFRLSRFSYAGEEFFFPTIANSTISGINNSYCFINWEDSLNVTTSDIVNIRESSFDKYTVKRVNRKYNDPIRKFIRSLN